MDDRVFTGKDTTFESSFPLFSDLLYRDAVGRLLGDYFRSTYTRHSYAFPAESTKYQRGKPAKRRVTPSIPRSWQLLWMAKHPLPTCWRRRGPSCLPPSLLRGWRSLPCPTSWLQKELVDVRKRGLFVRLESRHTAQHSEHPCKFWHLENVFVLRPYVHNYHSSNDSWWISNDLQRHTETISAST